MTTCKEGLGVIWVTVISNGNLNMPLGFTDHTVDHNSYRYWGCSDIRIDKHGAFSSAISFVGYSVRDVT